MTLKIGLSRQTELMSVNVRLCVMEYATDEVDMELVLPYLLYEGWANNFVSYREI